MPAYVNNWWASTDVSDMGTHTLTQGVTYTHACIPSGAFRTIENTCEALVGATQAALR